MTRNPQPAIDVVKGVEAGFRETLAAAEYLKIPMADRGEGVVAAIIVHTGYSLMEVGVTDPLKKRSRPAMTIRERKTSAIEIEIAS